MSGGFKCLCRSNKEVIMCAKTVTSCTQQHCETAKRHVDWGCQKWKVTDRETGFSQNSDLSASVKPS